MVCIYCAGSTSVINSRLQSRLNQVWRRRACDSCDSVFTTHEAVSMEQGLRVQKKGQETLEVFSRDRLFTSIYDSCGHRLHPVEDAAALTATVISSLRPFIKQAAVSRNNIVTVTSEALKRFDNAAFVHYTAYHKAD